MPVRSCGADGGASCLETYSPGRTGLRENPPGSRTGVHEPAELLARRRHGWTAEDYELSRAVFRKQAELIVPMHRAGVEFLAGTDVLNPY